jgi:hypothetical protein
VLVLGGVLRCTQAFPGLHHQAPAQPQRPQRGEEHDHDDAADEFADGELPPHQDHEDDPQLDHQIRRREHEDHGGDVVGALHQE